MPRLWVRRQSHQEQGSAPDVVTRGVGRDARREPRATVPRTQGKPFKEASGNNEFSLPGFAGSRGSGLLLLRDHWLS